MLKLPNGVEINNLIDDLRIFSWEASDILKYYSMKLKIAIDKDQYIQSKGLDDPVTDADLEVNKLIHERFNEKYSNINWQILSEENVKNDFNDFSYNSDWLWVFDPLDGTKDFIQNTNNFAMHLALNFKNKPLLGVVLIPAKDELWITNGLRTWCENKKGSRMNLNISNHENLQKMKLVISKNHRNVFLENLVEIVPFESTLIMGSIGCKIMSILKGESDIYITYSKPGFSSPKDWDFAAPEAILKTAGGAITTIDNEPLTYNNHSFKQEGLIVASGNKSVHRKLCDELKNIIRENKLY